MAINEWIGEIIAGSVAVLTGAWALVKLAIRTREMLEKRLDNIEHELAELRTSAVTYAELASAIKEIEERNERFYTRMDTKIDSIKSDMMWIMQAVGRRDD